MKTTNDMVVAQLQRVVNRILFLKKKSFFEFKGVAFYPSEIHLMLLIEEEIATNATRMAEQLGVTKGAVSQTLARLEKKSVLKKRKDPYKKNELTLKFTPFGAKALEHYRERAQELAEKHDRYLTGFSSGEKAVIQRFLVEVERVFDEMS